MFSPSSVAYPQFNHHNDLSVPSMNLANLCLGSTDESQKEVLQTESPQLSPPPPSVQSSEPLKKRTHSGIMLGCLSVFVSMVGASFTFPFLQSQRDSLGSYIVCILLTIFSKQRSTLKLNSHLIRL